MKTKVLLVLIFCANLVVAQTGTTYSKSFMSGGVSRSYRVYVPDIYDGSKAVPLVLNFHGLGSNSSEQETYGDFRKIADTANFIVVHPQGVSQAQLSNQSGWSAFGSYSQPGTTSDFDFVAALIDTIKANYTINAGRVFSAGMSNGAFMSFANACQLSSRFAAIAPVAGSMGALQISNCNLTHPTPVLMINGTADNLVKYDGTLANYPFKTTQIDTLALHWAKENNCNLTPTVENLSNSNLLDGSTVVHYVYSGGDNNSSVELYKVVGGGHSWPGAAVNIDVTNQDFDASKEIWRFFSQQKSLVTSDDELDKTTIDFTVYPNPSNGTIYVHLKEVADNYLVSIVNVLGTEVYCTNSTALTESYLTIANLNPGVYFIRLYNNYCNYTKKFIVE